MIHLFKNLNFGGLLALAVGMVLMVSWKAVESGKAAPQWYQVQLKVGGNPSELEDLEIVGDYPGGTPSGPTCNVNPGITCAVLLDLNGAPIPTNLQEAEDEGFTPLDSRQRQN